MQKQSDYNEAINTKFPEQVAVVIARDVTGKCNPITLGWCMNTSFEPPMFAFSIGKARYSLEAVRHARECVIAFPSERQADEALYYGTRSGRDSDKLREFGAVTSPAVRVDAVLLDDAVANFECGIVQEVETGTHVLFVAQVVAAHVNTEPSERIYQIMGGHALKGVKPKDS